MGHRRWREEDVCSVDREDSRNRGANFLGMFSKLDSSGLLKHKLEGLEYSNMSLETWRESRLSVYHGLSFCLIGNGVTFRSFW